MIVDILVLIVLGACLVWGKNRGAMKMLVSVIGFAISMVMGVLLYRPISELLEKLGIVDGLASKLVENVSNIANLPGIMRDGAQAAVTEALAARMLAQVSICAISLLTVVVLVRIVLLIVFSAVGLVGSLPVIKQANGLIGGICGVIVGLFVILLVFGAIAMADIFAKPGTAASVFNGSYLAVLIYNNNPILGIVVNAAAGLK